MARTLTDSAWTDIICAAAKREPDAEARTLLSKILFEEYPAFAYHAGIADAHDRAKRMLKHLAAIEADYRAAFQRADVRTEADLWCLKMLRRRLEAVCLAARAIRRANRGRKSAQREWVYHRLCSVWLDNFGAPALSYGRPSRGGPPGGPLINFMLAALAQIMPTDELPSAETLRDAVDRERIERDQLVSELRQRDPAIGD